MLQVVSDFSLKLLLLIGFLVIFKQSLFAGQGSERVALLSLSFFLLLYAGNSIEILILFPIVLVWRAISLAKELRDGTVRLRLQCLQGLGSAHRVASCWHSVCSLVLICLIVILIVIAIIVGIIVAIQILIIAILLLEAILVV